MSFWILKTSKLRLSNPIQMKKLLSLFLVTMLLAACGGPTPDEDSDLLDSILDDTEVSDVEDVEEYEIPSSDGPTSLPPEDDE